jgi:multidrug efflux pump subunit AcrA (membrane-fusion protein)
MRKNSIVQNWSFAGSGRLLIPLALGLILGAFLYSRFSGTGTSRDAVVLQDQKQESATIAAGNESVQIDGASQKEVGILAEPVVRRNLQDNLSATGTVREDPGRVAHVRPLARGLIKEVYVHLGDRVSTGDPLLEYDNMELGLAIGEFMGAQVELQRSLADIEVKKKILERSREMLREGAIARTSFLERRRIRMQKQRRRECALLLPKFPDRSAVSDGPTSSYRRWKQILKCSVQECRRAF